MYSRSSVPHQYRQIITATFPNVVQRYCPCEDAEFELQRFLGKADNESSVIHRVEKEENENRKKAALRMLGLPVLSLKISSIKKRIVKPTKSASVLLEDTLSS